MPALRSLGLGTMVVRALEGLARGFAYRLVENLGLIPRGDVAEEVRALDPAARTGEADHPPPLPGAH